MADSESNDPMQLDQEQHMLLLEGQLLQATYNMLKANLEQNQTENQSAETVDAQMNQLKELATKIEKLIEKIEQKNT